MSEAKQTNGLKENWLKNIYCTIRSSHDGSWWLLKPQRCGHSNLKCIGLFREERPIKSVCVCVSVFQIHVPRRHQQYELDPILNACPKGNYLDPESVTCMPYPSTYTGWWYTYPSEKYEFVSWDDHSQYMESHKIPWFHSPPTRYFINHY